MKETEDDTNRMERYTTFLDCQNQYGQNDYTTQGNLQINAIPPIKLPMASFSDLEQNILKFAWKQKDHKQPKQS